MKTTNPFEPWLRLVAATPAGRYWLAALSALCWWLVAGPDNPCR